MKNKKFDILVNFEKSDSITSDEIKIVKGDYNSIEFNFQLSKTDFSKAMFYMVKPSGLHFVSEIKNNKVTFEKNMAFNEVGKYLFSVALYGSDSRLTNTAKGNISVVDGQLDMDDEVVQEENYQILDSLITEVISLKEEIETTLATMDGVFKDVSYNATNGVLTFTKKDNSTVKIDLPLELLIKSGHYDSSTENLVLVLANNDTIKIPVAELVNEYYADGKTLELKTVNGKLTFNVKNGVYQEKVSGKGLSTNDFTNDYKNKVDSNTSNRHTHTNKSVLDGTTASFTTADKSNLDSNTTNRHSHSNKSILDGITASFTTADKSNLDSNTTNRHSHSNKSILDGITASFTTAYKNILDNIKTIATGGKFEDLTNKSVAGYHNSIFRGKNVTSYLTDGTLFTRISSGSFEDLFVGDYIVKNNITWRIAGFDVYLHKGDTELTKHHAIIVPDKHLTTAQMNSSNTTVGGYVASSMYTNTLPSILDTYITPVFGSHVIEIRNLLTKGINATGYNRYGINSGCSNDWAWYSRKVDLMNEVQVFGSIVWSSSGYETGSDNCQLPLFRLAPEFITNRSYWYWLRNITNASCFANVYYHGYGGNGNASATGGVRPCFYID